jgi:hypothetical protein
MRIAIAATPLAVSLVTLALETGPAHADAPLRSPQADDVYRQVFGEVDRTNLEDLMKKMTGYTPVTVAGQTYAITDRYTAASRQRYRAFWTSYFEALGVPVTELAFDVTRANVGELQGHDLEAVLPGKSKDSVVVVVHYDSMGPNGPDNPAVDDDMTGMAILMETARILVAHKAQLQHTVRFVAADYEETGGLEGSRFYASHIKSVAAQEGFALVAAVDNEQSGWNCKTSNMCDDDATGDTFDVFSCSGDDKNYSYPALGDLLTDTATNIGGMKVNRGCIGEHSDHYAMWEIGVPAVVYSEHDPFNNDHYDQEGNDTYDKIDLDYHFRIARIGVTFAARIAGLDATPSAAHSTGGQGCDVSRH